MKWVADNIPDREASVLDYGCGSGIIVQGLLDKDIKAFGCDLFYEAGDRSKDVSVDLLEKGIIRKMPDGKIPFEDNYFDIVVNNQVIEHVEDLDLVLSEIMRVLKPGGRVLSMFPHKNAIREGHCGIPCIHWFSSDSKIRVYYAALLRSLGLGYFKDKRSIMSWSRDYCKYIDNWTHYRTLDDIHRTYGKYFSSIQHIEDYWLKERYAGKYKFISFIPDSIKKTIVTKLSGLVFVAYK